MHQYKDVGLSSEGVVTHVVDDVGNEEGIDSGSINIFTRSGANTGIVLIIEDLASTTLLGGAGLRALITDYIVSYHGR